MGTFITYYIIIGFVLAFFCFKDDLGFGCDNFWISLLTFVLFVTLWLPLVVIMLIVGIITMFF